MYCTKCGREINTNNKFCNGCGNEIVVKTKKSERKFLFPIIGMLISLFSLVCFVFLPFVIYIFQLCFQMLFDFKTIEGDKWDAVGIVEFFDDYYSSGPFGSSLFTLFLTLVSLIIFIYSVRYLIKIKKKS